MLDAVDEAAGQPVGRRGGVDAGHPLGQLLQWLPQRIHTPIQSRNREPTVSPHQQGLRDQSCVELCRLAKSAQQPLFGVCLGHQAIVEAFGGVVGYAGEVVHGKAGRIVHDGVGLMRTLPSPFRAARYHSLAATRLPFELRVTAKLESGLVMAVEHETAPIAGVQFHPESLLTPHGGQLLQAVLDWAREHTKKAS